MSMVHVLEGDLGSEHDWAGRLQLSNKEVAHLVTAKILRPQQDLLRLSFVGLIAYSSHVVYSRPKFARDLSFSVNETIAILRRYFARGKSRKPVLDSFRDPEYQDRAALREFDVANELDSWFKAHGIYRREFRRLGSAGRTHWSRTISSQQPLHFQGSVIYPKLIAERREGALNEVSSLQLGITRMLLEKYDQPVPPGLYQSELAAGPLSCSWPLDGLEVSYYLRRLDSERRSVFRTDTLRLLATLRGALESLPGRAQQARIFGTTAFYSVWEDSCRVLFQDRLCVLQLRNPRWVLVNAETDIEHEQIPDLVFESGSTTYIADAKYYWPFPVSRPGLSDVVKQLYYSETADCSQAIRSLFLLPVIGASSPTHLGSTRIEGARRSFPVVEAWGIDPAKLLDNYVTGSLSRHLNQIIESFDARMPKMTEIVAQIPANV